MGAYTIENGYFIITDIYITKPTLVRTCKTNFVN